jgi:hypothetical protein
MTVAFALATCAFADIVTLKSGRVVHGNYLGGSPRQVRVEVGNEIQTLDVDDISRIEFGNPAPPQAPRTTELTPRRSDDNVFRPADTPPPAPAPAPVQNAAGMDLPTGTNIVVRTIDGVDSEKNQVGDTFTASVDEPVMINGATVIPRGADVIMKLVDSKESGKLTGRSELTLDLVSVKVDGRLIKVDTQTVSMASSSRGERTAKVAGGTAAVGAIIGAIAGGGKGAALGAAAGGAAGAGAQVITKGQQVKIPSETRLTFVTDNPVRF